MPAREAVQMAYAYKVRPRWLRLRDHLRASFVGADPRVCIAFWLFGKIDDGLTAYPTDTSIETNDWVIDFHFV